MRKESNTDYISGRRAVREALDAGLNLDKLYIAKGDIDAAGRSLISVAKAAGVVVVEADRRRLDDLCGSPNHQGVLAVAAVCEYATVDDILQLAAERNEPPFLVICDEIMDPHNLGAIIRTAEGAGAHGVIIPKRRSAGLTSIVQKTSAGAVNHLPVARVPNLTAAIKTLQAAGIWIYGAAMDGAKDLWNTDFSGAVGLVIGNEGQGISRLVAEQCDFLVRIPMLGRVGSLNASVSAGLLLYEVVRQRTVTV